MDTPFHGVACVTPMDTHWLHTGRGGDTAGCFTHGHMGVNEFVQNPCLGLKSPLAVPGRAVYEGDAESLELGRNRFNFSETPPPGGHTFFQMLPPSL